MRSLYILRSSRGLWGNHIDVRTGIWTHRDSGIGPNQDSFYEYLLKGYIMTGDVEFLEMFDTAYDAINAYMKKVSLGIFNFQYKISSTLFFQGLFIIFVRQCPVVPLRNKYECCTIY